MRPPSSAPAGAPAATPAVTPAVAPSESAVPERATARHALERRVLDALPVAVCTADLEGRITSVGGAWRRLAVESGAGWLADEDATRGTAVWDAIGGAPREQIERAMQLLRSGRSHDVQWELRRDSADGERVLLVHVTPLRGDGGDRAVAGFVFAAVDISPSHRARAALLDTGLALARTLDLERVWAEVAVQIRHAMRGDACCLALADDPSSAAVGATAAPRDTLPPLRVVHQFGYDAGDAEGTGDGEGRADVRALSERLAPA